MKILAFVDIHGDSAAIKRIAEKEKKGKPDLLVCSGDVSNFGFGLFSLIKKLSFGIPLLIIPGNHETREEIEYMGKKTNFVKNLHLKHFISGNYFFTGCGGGGFTKRHTEFEQSEKKFAEAIKKLKVKDHKYKIILVTHQPPYGTKLDYIHGEHAGSVSIRKFIEKYQPVLCLCGHLHENEGKMDKIGKTIVINPGPEGKIIEI